MSEYTFIHVGDAHLQSTNPRNAARLQALDQIIDGGLSTPNLAGWLWPGDVFHGRSTAQDRNDLAERLIRMAACAPVVVVRGNHDAPGDLDIFGALGATYPIHVVTEPRVVAVQIPDGAIVYVACLPYPHKAGIIAAGASAEESGGLSNQLLLDVCRGLTAELATHRAAGRITMLIGHVNVAGAVASSGQPQIGVELSATADCFAPFMGDYVGLNHIHAPQDIGGASYAGSIAPMDYGEVHGHSYSVVTYRSDPFAGTHVLLTDVTRVPIHTARLYHVEGTLNGPVFDWSVTSGPGGDPQDAPESWAGCEVRVRFRFPASSRGVVDTVIVRAPFADADRVDLEPIAVPDTQVRAPQVAAARTLADKLAAWAELNGSTLSRGVVEKLASLERGEAADLILQAARPREEVAA